MCLLHKTLLFFLLGSPVFLSAKRVQIELQTGASVSGEVLKKTFEYWVIDLGYTILRVPTKECIKVSEAQSGKVIESGKKTDLYRTDKQLKNRPLGDLVAELGECVVMIRTPTGLGSGFLIHPDGYVITNDHVVAGERQVSITQFRQKDGELTKDNYDNVRIVATGGNVDLALLKIEGHSNKVFPSVPLGSSAELRQGERVFAIGSPLGLERSVSEGIVSLRNRIIQDRLHIQTTAEISPGNSGGPLFNYRGQVVGVNNMKVVSTGAEGLGFSIPVRELKTFLENRDAFAFDPRNPNAGYRYVAPPR
jgi:serine protease Do